MFTHILAPYDGSINADAEERPKASRIAARKR